MIINFREFDTNRNHNNPILRPISPRINSDENASAEPRIDYGVITASNNAVGLFGDIRYEVDAVYYAEAKPVREIDIIQNTFGVGPVGKRKLKFRIKRE